MYRSPKRRMPIVIAKFCADPNTPANVPLVKKTKEVAPEEDGYGQYLLVERKKKVNRRQQKGNQQGGNYIAQALPINGGNGNIQSKQGKPETTTPANRGQQTVNGSQSLKTGSRNITPSGNIGPSISTAGKSKTRSSGKIQLPPAIVPKLQATPL